MRWGAEVYQKLKSLAKKEYGQSAGNVGDEGGVAPDIQTADEALTLITTAIKEAGYEGRASGENIAKGQESPEEVVQGWMESKAHRENILRDHFSEVGFGFVKDKENNWVWVTNFGGR